MSLAYTWYYLHITHTQSARMVRSHYVHYFWLKFLSKYLCIPVNHHTPKWQYFEIFKYFYAEFCFLFRIFKLANLINYVLSFFYMCVCLPLIFCSFSCSFSQQKNLISKNSVVFRIVNSHIFLHIYFSKFKKKITK